MNSIVIDKPFLRLTLVSLFLLNPSDQTFRKILIVNDHDIAPVDKKVHPVPASQYIQQFRDTESSHHTVLLILQAAEPDLGDLNLVFVYDPRPCQSLIRMP